jgi:hypothetical protein
MANMVAKAKKLNKNDLSYQVSHRNGIKLHNNGDFIVFETKHSYNIGALKIAAILDSSDMKDMKDGKINMIKILSHLRTRNLIGAIEFCKIKNKSIDITFHAVHFRYCTMSSCWFVHDSNVDQKWKVNKKKKWDNFTKHALRIIIYDISLTASTFDPKQVGNNLSANQIATTTGRNKFSKTFNKPPQQWKRSTSKQLANQSIQRYISSKFELPEEGEVI